MHDHRRTSAVHAGRADLRDLGVHAPPIDLSSTYPIDDLEAGSESLLNLAQGHPCRKGADPIYQRLWNPTVARFEEGLAQLEGAEAAVAFSSGMAALTAVLLAARARGNHVLAIRPLYGGSDHLLSSDLLGIETEWVTPEGVADAVRDDTAIVILETPANPTLALVDIAAVVASAGDVPVLVDSTFATPILQRPLRRGAALVLHSATKFLGGHGDVVGGVVAGSEAWMARLRQVRVATGGILHPMAGYLLHRGLPTLPVRVETAQSTARRLAERLLGHSDVTEVFYPGLLPASDPHGLIGTQMDGPGALIAFTVRGGRYAACRTLSNVRIATPAVSLGSVDTLIQHPAGLTHGVVPEEAREAHAVSECMLRISVGLEDADDLWQDLRDAISLAHCAPHDVRARPAGGRPEGEPSGSGAPGERV